MEKDEIIKILEQASQSGKPVLIQDAKRTGPMVWIVSISKDKGTVRFSGRDIYNNVVPSLEIPLDQISTAFGIEHFGITLAKPLE